MQNFFVIAEVRVVIQRKFWLKTVYLIKLLKLVVKENKKINNISAVFVSLYHMAVKENYGFSFMALRPVFIPPPPICHIWIIFHTIVVHDPKGVSCP